MRRVQLHDGRELEFPPETTDDVVRSVVRRQLGIKEPDDPTATSQSQIAELVAGALSPLSMLPTKEGQDRLIDDITGALQGFTERMEQTITKLIEHSDQRSETMLKEVANALTKAFEKTDISTEKQHKDHKDALATAVKVVTEALSMQGESYSKQVKKLAGEFSSQVEKITQTLSLPKVVERDKDGRLLSVRTEG